MLQTYHARFGSNCVLTGIHIARAKHKLVLLREDFQKRLAEDAGLRKKEEERKKKGIGSVRLARLTVL